jgi:ubiquitin-protein ligase E3 C
MLTPKKGYGLFSLTSNHVLFPNPAASLLYPEDEIESLYTFLGRVLGKALYENITVQPQFAHFMLNFMNGKVSVLLIIITITIIITIIIIV